MIKTNIKSGYDKTNGKKWKSWTETKNDIIINMFKYKGSKAKVIGFDYI